MGDGVSKAKDHEEEDDFEFDDSLPNHSSSKDLSPSNHRQADWAVGPPQGDTLIIFDWDDTLLCSTAINANQWTVVQLQQLERTVDAILCLAMRLGETMIVTNGNGTWVHDSSRRFLPGLAPTLARLQVLSARAMYEEMYPGDPFAWKRGAFRQILEERRLARWARGGDSTPDRNAASHEPLNLVVLGDSPAEMEAAHSATQAIGGTSLVKTVKFMDAPTVPQLLGQLRRTARELAGLVRLGRSTSRGLEPHQLPSHGSHMATWAAGWRLCEWRSWSSPQDFSISRTLFKAEEDDIALELPELPDWMVNLKERMSCYAVPGP